MKGMRSGALAAIAIVVTASAVTSFAESYRGLFLWASRHGLHGLWAILFPLQVDTFVLVGELALLVALVDRWPSRSRTAAWAVTLAGLAVSVAGNVGHVAGGSLADRGTAAIPPLAAATALAVGLGVLKRVVAQAVPAVPIPDQAGPADAMEVAREAYAASVTAGQPLSQREIARRSGLSRRQAGQLVAQAADG